MNKPDQKRSDRQAAMPSRVEEILRVIEDYADDLREIIKKLRRKMD